LIWLQQARTLSANTGKNNILHNGVFILFYFFSDIGICYIFFLIFINLFFKKIIHLFTYVYIVWVISPPRPPPLPFFPSSPQFQAGPVLPLSLILLKKRHKHNKKGKVFLLVELRIVIQKDSYYCFHVPMCYNPCSFNSDWSLPWFLILCSW
jgi:hypothetical protein